MRSERTPMPDTGAGHGKLLLWALGIALLCWLIQAGQPLEDSLRSLRNRAHETQASGDIVFVGIDDKSLQQVGTWPWPRSTQAKLIDRATALGAKSIHLDLIYDSPSTIGDDAAFAAALKRSGRVVVADRHLLGSRYDQKAPPTRPLSQFRAYAKTASITLFYDYRLAVWEGAVNATIEGKTTPTFAASLAGKTRGSGEFWIDYSIRPSSIPYASATDLLGGKIKPNALRGKQVIIGLNADQLGDKFWLPGYGRMAGAYVHVLAAETLRRGTPISWGALPALLLALAASTIALVRPRYLILRPLTLASAFLVLLFLPIVLEKNFISVEVFPGLVLLTVVSARLAYLKYKSRGLVHEQTGLASFAALRGSGKIDQALILAKIHNHAEISSALTDVEQQEAYRQVVARLSTGDQNALHQGDDGTFAWTVPTNSPIGNHLEALHAMFRSPVQVAGRNIDVALSFGVELGVTRTLANRIGSAIMAADEAWAEGLRWKLHDPARQEEVNWRVSLLGELDAAIDQGEVWLAYQPQLDITNGQIVGAEALARWTHPKKGPISPTEFIAAAEANGRIGKLSDFVLDRAIASAAAINRRGVPFQVAVNLSARLLTDRELLGRIEHMLAAHGLSAARLTLELTETATLQDAEGGLAVLDAMRRLGIRIAIDDYGTGLSTLEYLKKIPASEIKIDQSFVKSMRVNRSDLIMVQSTIALAHSLGRTVVAEGVEDQQCLDELRQMGCDIAQGFAIGRPMGVRELIQRLHIRSAKRVA